MTLPALIRKAVGDAGFDLVLNSDAEWRRIAVSGLPIQAWVLPVRAGALLALADERLARELSTTSWTDVPLPYGAVAAVRCQTASELYNSLRRARILIPQLPPIPTERFAKALAAIETTERTSLITQRVGQTLFREMLLEYWEGRCAVTGLAVTELLRASHAKPWADSNDDERLDVFNGLLLAVHLDALFDHGFMTFDDDGAAVFSDVLASSTLKTLHVGSGNMRLNRIAEGHRPYLAYHRKHVFRKD